MGQYNQIRGELRGPETGMGSVYGLLYRIFQVLLEVSYRC